VTESPRRRGQESDSYASLFNEKRPSPHRPLLSLNWGLTSRLTLTLASISYARNVRIFLALIVGIIIGAAGLWFFSSGQGRSRAQAAGTQIQNAATSARDAIEDKLRILDLRTNDIKDELARTGQVVRRKAREAGQAIADATADARTTAAIKTKLIASRELSGLGISVNTTGGIVTLSGSVSSTDAIGKAMVLAMETDGVREVISTLQVKARGGKS
jgi:hyperosmotically inducible periplasmic protein